LLIVFQDNSRGRERKFLSKKGIETTEPTYNKK
jgi:hypothetical protein